MDSDDFNYLEEMATIDEIKRSVGRASNKRRIDEAEISQEEEYSEQEDEIEDEIEKVVQKSKSIQSASKKNIVYNTKSAQAKEATIDDMVDERDREEERAMRGVESDDESEEEPGESIQQQEGTDESSSSEQEEGNNEEGNDEEEGDSEGEGSDDEIERLASGIKDEAFASGNEQQEGPPLFSDSEEEEDEDDWIAKDGDVEKIEMEYRQSLEKKKKNGESNGEKKKKKIVGSSLIDEPSKDKTKYSDEEEEYKEKKGKFFVQDAVENSSDEDEEQFSVVKEFYMDWKMKPDSELFEIYKGYFIYQAMCGVKSDYPKYIKDTIEVSKKQETAMMEEFVAFGERIRKSPELKESLENKKAATLERLTKLKEKIKNLEFQVKSVTVIQKKVIEEVITVVIEWIIHHQNKQISKTLQDILMDWNEGKEKVLFMKFSSIKPQHRGCAISGKEIKAGNAWKITRVCYKEPWEEIDIIHYHWVEFLSCWQTIVKHDNMVQGLAIHSILEEDGTYKMEKLAAFLNNHAAIDKYMKLLMGSIAWIYKELDDCKDGMRLIEKLDTKWYTVFSPSKQNGKPVKPCVINGVSTKTRGLVYKPTKEDVEPFDDSLL